MTVVVTHKSLENELKNPNSEAFGHLSQSEKDTILQNFKKTMQPAQPQVQYSIPEFHIPRFEIPSFDFEIPDFSNLTGGNPTYRIERGSDAYGFSGQGPINPIGKPVPVVLGRHRVRLIKINSYIKYDGEKNFLYFLGAVGEGEVNSISSIEVNQTAISAYDATTYTRTGTKAQSIVPGFEDLHDLLNPGVALLAEGGNLEYTTTISNATSLEISVLFTKGLYTFNKRNGASSNNTATIKIWYRVNGSGAYSLSETFTVTVLQKNQFYKSFRITGLTAGRYDIKVENTTPERTSESKEYLQEVYLYNVDQIQSYDVAYIHTALVGIVIEANENIFGTDPEFSALVEGIMPSIPAVLDKDSNPVDWEDYFLDTNTAEADRFQQLGSTVKKGVRFNNDDTSNGYITVGTYAEFGTPPISFYCEFESDNFTKNWIMAIQTCDNDVDASVFYKWRVRVKTDGYVEFYVWDDGTPSAHVILSDAATVLRQRYKIYVTLDSAFNMKMYIDGTLQANTENAGSINSGTLENFKMGSEWTGGGGGNGRIFEAKIWSKALNQSQVTEDVATGHSNSLISSWALDEGSGTDVVDSIRGYDGVFDGGTDAPTWIESGFRYSWDGSTLTPAWCASPIYLLQHLITDTRYGLGGHLSAGQLSAANLLTEFYETEKRISDLDGGYEKQFELHAVLDSSTAAMDLIAQLCDFFRCKVFNENNTLRFKVLKEEDTTRLLTMGNIMEGSFAEDLGVDRQTPNVFEIAFKDVDNGYAKDYVISEDQDSLAAGDPIEIYRFNLLTAKRSQARRYAEYLKNNYKYIKKRISLMSEMMAYGVQVGDIVEVQHDVPGWGIGDVCHTGSTTTNVKLLDPDSLGINLVTGTTALKIQFMADDTIEERTITTSPGSSITEVTVSSAFSQAPTRYDPWIIGTAKKFRVSDYSIEGLHRFKLNLLEYNASLYNISGVVLPTPNVSLLNSGIPNVADLTLKERIQRKENKEQENVIEVWFRKPDMSSYDVLSYLRAFIYLSRDSGSTWQFVGRTESTTFDIIGSIEELTTYKVAVVSVSAHTQNPIASSPQATIYYKGKFAPPTNVTAFNVAVDTQTGELVFNWNAVPDIDLFGYEIREESTFDWDSADVIKKEIQGTTYRFKATKTGTLKFMIRAQDTSLNYSNASATTTLTISTVPHAVFRTEENLFDFTLNSGAKSYTSLDIMSGTIQKYITDSNGAYVVDSIGKLLVRQATTSLYLELTQTGDDYATSAEYEADERDIGSQQRFALHIMVNAELGDATYEIHIRTKDDGGSYGAYAAWHEGDYEARYYQVKLVVTNFDTDKTARFFKMTARPVTRNHSEVHEVTFTGSGQATLTFDNTYYSKPSVLCTAEGNEMLCEKVTFNTSGGKYVSVDLELYDTSSGRTLTSGDATVQVYGS